MSSRQYEDLKDIPFCLIPGVTQPGRRNTINLNQWKLKESVTNTEKWGEQNEGDAAEWEEKSFRSEGKYPNYSTSSCSTHLHKFLKLS